MAPLSIDPDGSFESRLTRAAKNPARMWIVVRAGLKGRGHAIRLARFLPDA